MIDRRIRPKVPLAVLGIAVAALTLRAQEASGSHLSDRATDIVVGSVQSGRQIGRSVSFSISVARSLKGPLQPGEDVRVTGTLLLGTGAASLPDASGLWLLGQDGSGGRTMLPVLAGPFEFAYYPVPLDRPTAVSAGALQPATVDDQLALEFAAALPLQRSRPRRHLLESGLMAVADSNYTNELLEAMRQSSDPEVMFVALAKLLRAGDRSALGDVAARVDLMRDQAATFFIIPEIGGWHDPDPIAVGYLGQVAASTDVFVQKASARALMSIHTRECLPYLARLLDSADGDTRAFAMQGLSCFVQRLPIAVASNILSGKATVPQGPAPYRTAQTDRYSLANRALAGATEPESAFLLFWKGWWLANEASLKAPAGRHSRL